MINRRAFSLSGCKGLNLIRRQRIGAEFFSDRLRIEPPAAESGSGAIAVVDLDEAIRKEYGEWPWPRYLLASLPGATITAGALKCLDQLAQLDHADRAAATFVRVSRAIK